MHIKSLTHKYCVNKSYGVIPVRVDMLFNWLIAVDCLHSDMSGVTHFIYRGLISMSG